MITGQVAWFDPQRGLGFISQEGGPDVFVHHSKIIAPPNQRRQLAAGDLVEFQIADLNGRLQAVDVKQVGHAADEWRRLG